MSTSSASRIVLVVVEVADVERSAALYRDGFGVDLHLSDHHGGPHGDDDRWTSGQHAACSWTDGAYLHFALYPAKGDGPTRNVQLGFHCDDLAVAHERALAAGAALVHPPRDEPWGATARYLDFDGNVLSLTQAQS